VDTTELLATELLTNALQHTRGDAVLTATVTSGGAGARLPARRLRVEVRDSLAGRPSPRVGTADGTSGRGLLLVDALADAWGVQPCGRGKSIWFELHV
jgi:hypothetical protein